MPIQGQGWELLVTRVREDRRGTNRRTVSRYQVYHDGAPIQALSGMCAETRGPGDNSVHDNNRRIEPGRYPLGTHSGPRFETFGFQEHGKKPALEVKMPPASPRDGILIHPGQGFKASVGCFNPARALPNAAAVIDFADSLARVLAIIADMKTFLGTSFPNRNDRPIPNAWLITDGEPAG